MDFTVKIEKKNIYDYVMFHTFGKTRGKMLLLIGVIALVMLGVMWKDYKVIHRVLLGFISLYYLVILPIMTVQKAKKLAANERFYVPIHYVFSAEEIQVTQGEETANYRWEDGLLFVSRKNLVYMYVSVREAYMIPKDQVPEYMNLLSMAVEHGCPVRNH